MPAGNLADRWGEWLLSPVRVYNRIPTGVAGFLVLLLFLTASWMITRWIMDEARGLDDFTIDPTQVRCSARPEWLDMSSDTASDIMSRVRGTLSRFRNQSIFNDKFLQLLREDLGRGCPWVEVVVAAEREFPSQLKVRLRLRRPASVVYRRSTGYYVDSRGVIIDAFSISRKENIAAAGLPVIRGADLSAPPRVGRMFQDDALREGAAVGTEILDLARLLGPLMVPIKSIDVSGYGRGRPDDVILITEGNTRLLWGRSARHAAYRGIDPSLEEKANNLEKVLADRPGLKGVAEVTLTFQKPSYSLRTDGITGN